MAKQTAGSQIKKVLVSENSGSNAAEKVCSEFDALPIQYKFRNPPIEAIQHLPVLLSETETECVAILHDDDWWHSSHLENGLKYLTSDTSAAAYGASYFRVTGESSWLRHLGSTFWAGANYPPLTDVWKLDLKQVALACLWGTPCHYSTLLSYKRHLAACSDVYIKQQNVFDNDKVLIVELAKIGAIYFNPVPEVFVRYHLGTDTLRYIETRDSYVGKTTDYLLDQCEQAGIDVTTDMEAIFVNCPQEARYHVFTDFERASVKALERRHALPPTLARYFASKRFKRLVKQVVPRALFNRVHALIYNQ